MYQFLDIYYGLVRIFNSSDDALLVRAKRQILRKTWISQLDLYSITSYQLYSRNKTLCHDCWNSDEIVLLGKAELNTVEVLISKSLIESYISHDEFVSVNNVLREYNEMKEEIKTSV